MLCTRVVILICYFTCNHFDVWFCKASVCTCLRGQTYTYLSKPITYTIPYHTSQPTNQPASQPTNQPASQPTSQPAQPTNQPASPTQPTQPNHHPPSQPAYKVRGSVSYQAKVPIIGGCRRGCASLQKYRVLPLLFYANK